METLEHYIFELPNDNSSGILARILKDQQIIYKKDLAIWKELREEGISENPPVPKGWICLN